MSFSFSLRLTYFPFACLPAFIADVLWQWGKIMAVFGQSAWNLRSKIIKQFQNSFKLHLTLKLCRFVRYHVQQMFYLFEIVSMQYENSRSVLTFSDNKTFAFWGKFAFSLFWWKWDFIQRHIWSEIWTACKSCSSFSSCSSSQKYKIRAATHNTKFEQLCVLISSAFILLHISIQGIHISK